MRTLPLLLSLLLTTGISSTALAQASPAAQDSLSRRIHYLDSLATADEQRINAITLTDTATRARINSSLRSAAATTSPPAAAPVSATAYPEANGQRMVYDTGNIIDVLRHPKSNLVAVCAHRGYFQESGVPENSLKAIQRASDNSLEIVELDIKMSRDGVPVLSHDLTVGRVTVGGGYDLVANFTSGALQRYTLKDKNGTATNEHLATLEQALDYIHDHRIAIVVALDIKDRNAARACWEIVKRKSNAWSNPAYNWVVFKINATVYPFPADLVYDISGMVNPPAGGGGGPWTKGFYYDKLLYIPVYTTNMVDKLDCLDSQRQYKGQPFTVAFEVNYKQEGGILTNLMADLHADALRGAPRTKAIFNAIPDAPTKGADRFWKADGYNTYRLQDIYYTARNGDHDTDDRRGDWGFLTDQRAINFHLITTDLPTSLSRYLGGYSLRYTHWYRLHPDGLDDETDPHSAGASSTSARTAAVTAAKPTPEATTSSALGAYPNPTPGNLTVSLNQAQEGKVQFRLTDQLGRTVLTQEQVLRAGPQQVTLPNLRTGGAKPGLYLLQITSPKGQPRQTIKVQVN